MWRQPQMCLRQQPQQQQPQHQQQQQHQQVQRQQQQAQQQQPQQKQQRRQKSHPRRQKSPLLQRSTRLPPSPLRKLLLIRPRTSRREEWFRKRSAPSCRPKPRTPCSSWDRSQRVRTGSPRQLQDSSFDRVRRASERLRKTTTPLCFEVSRNEEMIRQKRRGRKRRVNSLMASGTRWQTGFSTALPVRKSSRSCSRLELCRAASASQSPVGHQALKRNRRPWWRLMVAA
mmetsp:Transcript_87866/g.158401  ORF Transcript_87866/g.158401 Transcript_87866/m.158401 type:complete len:229 (+) Transcript_87866:1314-2000(+)